MAFRAARLAIAISTAALLAACSQTDTPDAAPSTPTTQIAASTTAAAATTAPVGEPSADSPAQLRAITCTGLLGTFANARDIAAELGDSSWTPDEMAAKLVAEGPKSAEWAGWSSEQKAAWEAGIRDAATGSCS